MKEFGLSVLKSIVSYLILFVMAFVGLVSLTSGEFPPSKKALLGGVERLKKSYASLAKMQDLLPQMKQTAQEPTAQPNPLQAMQAMLGAQNGGSSGGESEAPDMAASMALIQGMMQQMAAAQGQMGGGLNTSGTGASTGGSGSSTGQSRVMQLDPSVMRQLTKIEQQNNELIQRMSRIQTYLLGLHEYLKQTRQPAAATGAAPQPQRR